MSGAPTVSLAIVSRDRPNELARLMSALRFQRRPPDEIILVTNLTPEAVSSAGQEITHITYDEANISRARNLAIAAAAGDVIAFCDDDAVPEFGWLSALMEPFSSPRVGSVAGFVRGRNGVDFQSRCVLVNRSGDDIILQTDPTAIRLIPPMLGAVLKPVGTNCAFRRAALAQIGGFDAAIRFYLDEVDVGFRLAEKGWMAAIAPLAEVHHNFAAGPRRTAHRVPRSLFETAASLAHFIRRHSQAEVEEKVFDAFRERERQRLLRLMGYGLLDGRAIAPLMAGLEDGLRTGAAREPDLAAIAAPDRALTLRATPSAQRQLIVSRPFKRRGAHERARANAAAGVETTLIEIDLSPRPLSLRYTVEGYWHHRLGILGRDARKAGWRPAGMCARLARELARIKAQRGFGTENSLL